MCVCVCVRLRALINASSHAHDFPTEDLRGGPGIKTPCFQRKGRRFNPWSGKEDHICGTA